MSDTAGYSRFLTRGDQILPGVRRVVQVPNPQAGADWIVTVPSGVEWRITTGTALFTTSIAVANRRPVAVCTSDGVQIGSWSVNGTIPASLPIQISFGPEITTQASSTANLPEGIVIPQLWLPAGSTFGFATNAIQAADQWSGIALYVDEVYFTDQELAEWHERELEAIRSVLTRQ